MARRRRPPTQQRQPRAVVEPQQQPAPLPAPQSEAGPGGQPPATHDVLNGLISALEATRNSRVLVYWTTPLARMSEAAVLPLYDQLTSIGHVDHFDLFLQTGGGDTEVPWRMVSLIREFCETFTVIVPHRAASSGTLLALGADEIVMTPLSVLGPIDPSRTHPLLPRRDDETEPEPVSVQDMRHAMQFIRDAMGHSDESEETPYTPEAMAQIFSALFDKLHPLVIGAIEQSYALSKLIGTRCLETHMDPASEADAIREIVDTLCDDFKSHQYQIPRVEARRVGLKVKDASSAEQAAITDLYKHYLSLPFGPPQPLPKAGQQFQHTIAWLDSTSLHMQVEAQAELTPNGQLKALGDAWASY
jgi:hypothetical protein